ncbi:hypothetical protein M885DRAFT_624635 [Pelagophyceae sp. CCMP2097]|nr:hypothetical protein M885DRAFT_624635 [Pelagophyceae sp. CCMP2097]
MLLLASLLAMRRCAQGLAVAPWARARSSYAVRRAGPFALGAEPPRAPGAAQRGGAAARAAALPSTKGLLRGDSIWATIVSFGPMGASVDVAGRFGEEAMGLVLQSELKLFRQSREGKPEEVGELLPAYVEYVHDNGKVDVSLRPPSKRGKLEDAKAQILQALRAGAGELPVGDKSQPEEVSTYLPGLSKTIFKQAVGSLFKEGLVEPTGFEIRLMAPPTKAAAPQRDAPPRAPATPRARPGAPAATPKSQRPVRNGKRVD